MGPSGRIRGIHGQGGPASHGPGRPPALDMEPVLDIAPAYGIGFLVPGPEAPDENHSR